MRQRARKSPNPLLACQFHPQNSKPRLSLVAEVAQPGEPQYDAPIDVILLHLYSRRWFCSIPLSIHLPHSRYFSFLPASLRVFLRLELPVTRKEESQLLSSPSANSFEMNAGGPGGQGGPGSGTGSGSGGQQGSPDQITVATSTPVTATTFITSTAYPSTATTSITPSSTSAAASSKSSNSISVGPIIGGVAGGVAVLSVIAVLLVLYLQGRKKKKLVAKKEKRSTAEQTTYAGLNSSFSGVPFAHSPNREHHDSLLPAPLFSPSTSPYSRVEMRGGETSPYSMERHGGETSPYSLERPGGKLSPHSLPAARHGGQTSPYSLPGESNSNFESERFLSTDGESISTTGRESHVRIDTTHHNDIVSPISTRDAHPTHRLSTIICPQTPEEAFDPPAGISVPMFLIPQQTRDTMGFPVDSPIEQQRRLSFPAEPDQQHETEYKDTPLAAPSPRHQNPLERLVRDGMMTPEPSHQISNLRRPARILNESPVLGNRHTVKMYAPPPSSGLQHSVRRNESHRTVSSMGSNVGHMVSDEELERLGVGRI
jgi:hypothetical protein